MGFLDGSTNNLILDAVLTDTGRQFLSRNDGSFSIQKFALGDDEVNYNIISKYGRTVGKEKIEKNTPVFEALTNQSHALKYKLVSVSNPNLIRLPTLSLAGGSNVSETDNTVTLGRNTQKSAIVSLEQVIQNETSIDQELRDQVFQVEVPYLFVQLEKSRPVSVDNQQRAYYLISKDALENAYNGSIVKFTVTVKALSDAIFTVYGTSSNKSIIKSFIKVTGLQSGAVKDITLLVNKNL